MACRYENKLNDANFCKVKCYYCTLTQQEECKRKHPEYFEEEKFKHPFAITCKRCGSNNIHAFACEHNDLVIRCKDCGLYLNCGSYDTKESDYSKSYN